MPATEPLPALNEHNHDGPSPPPHHHEAGALCSLEEGKVVDAHRCASPSPFRGFEGEANLFCDDEGNGLVVDDGGEDVIDGEAEASKRSVGWQHRQSLTLRGCLPTKQHAAPLEQHRVQHDVLAKRHRRLSALQQDGRDAVLDAAQHLRPPSMASDQRVHSASSRRSSGTAPRSPLSAGEATLMPSVSEHRVVDVSGSTARYVEELLWRAKMHLWHRTAQRIPLLHNTATTAPHGGGRTRVAALHVVPVDVVAQSVDVEYVRLATAAFPGAFHWHSVAHGIEANAMAEIDEHLRVEASRAVRLVAPDLIHQMNEAGETAAATGDGDGCALPMETVEEDRSVTTGATASMVLSKEGVVVTVWRSRKCGKLFLRAVSAVNEAIRYCQLPSVFRGLLCVSCAHDGFLFTVTWLPPLTHAAAPLPTSGASMLSAATSLLSVSLLREEITSGCVGCYACADGTYTVVPEVRLLQELLKARCGPMHFASMLFAHCLPEEALPSQRVALALRRVVAATGANVQDNADRRVLLRDLFHNAGAHLRRLLEARLALQSALTLDALEAKMPPQAAQRVLRNVQSLCQLMLSECVARVLKGMILSRWHRTDRSLDCATLCGIATDVLGKYRSSQRFVTGSLLPALAKKFPVGTTRPLTVDEVTNGATVSVADVIAFLKHRLGLAFDVSKRAFLCSEDEGGLGGVPSTSAQLMWSTAYGPDAAGDTALVGVQAVSLRTFPGVTTMAHAVEYTEALSSFARGTVHLHPAAASCCLMLAASFAQTAVYLKLSGSWPACVGATDVRGLRDMRHVNELSQVTLSVLHAYVRQWVTRHRENARGGLVAVDDESAAPDDNAEDDWNGCGPTDERAFVSKLIRPAPHIVRPQLPPIEAGEDGNGTLNAPKALEACEASMQVAAGDALWVLHLSTVSSTVLGDKATSDTEDAVVDAAATPLRRFLLFASAVASSCSPCLQDSGCGPSMVRSCMRNERRLEEVALLATQFPCCTALITGNAALQFLQLARRTLSSACTSVRPCLNMLKDDGLAAVTMAAAVAIALSHRLPSRSAGRHQIESSACLSVTENRLSLSMSQSLAQASLAISNRTTAQSREDNLALLEWASTCILIGLVRRCQMKEDTDRRSSTSTEDSDLLPIHVPLLPLPAMAAECMLDIALRLPESDARCWAILLLLCPALHLPYMSECCANVLARSILERLTASDAADGETDVMTPTVSEEVVQQRLLSAMCDVNGLLHRVPLAPMDAWDDAVLLQQHDDGDQLAVERRLVIARLHCEAIRSNRLAANGAEYSNRRVYSCLHCTPIRVRRPNPLYSIVDTPTHVKHCPMPPATKPVGSKPLRPVGVEQPPIHSSRSNPEQDEPGHELPASSNEAWIVLDPGMLHQKVVATSILSAAAADCQRIDDFEASDFFSILLQRALEEKQVGNAVLPQPRRASTHRQASALLNAAVRALLEEERDARHATFALERVAREGVVSEREHHIATSSDNTALRWMHAVVEAEHVARSAMAFEEAQAFVCGIELPARMEAFEIDAAVGGEHALQQSESTGGGDPPGGVGAAVLVWRRRVAPKKRSSTMHNAIGTVAATERQILRIEVEERTQRRQILAACDALLDDALLAWFLSIGPPQPQVTDEGDDGR